MKVRDHNKYRLFEYDNYMNNKNFELGQVLFCKDKVEHEENPIGVVVQLHEDGDCRTDMYGNVSLSEVRTATKQEVEKYLPKILNDLI